MFSVAIVLFTLQRFDSPTLAGAAVFASVFPGVVASPLAGALLDRRGRVPLIRLDFVVAAATTALIVGLAASGALDAPLLILIAAMGSVTYPLSSSGVRSLLPRIVPVAMWDRVNAADSLTYIAAQVVGAPLAGAIAGLVSRPAALAATALIYAAAAVSLIRLRPPPGPPTAVSRSTLRDAWQGLQYVARNPALRGLAVGVSALNVAAGLLVVALPVLVLDHLHQGAAVVGLLWGLSGLSGALAAVAVGRLGTLGRERSFIVTGMLGTAAGLALLAVSPNLAVAVIAMLVYGAAFGGPMDVGMFSIRQRQTDPAWYGRAFAVSMSLNFVGSPVGSAMAGPLLGAGMIICLSTAAGFSCGAALLAHVMLPKGGRTG